MPLYVTCLLFRSDILYSRRGNLASCDCRKCSNISMSERLECIKHVFRWFDIHLNHNDNELENQNKTPNKRKSKEKFMRRTRDQSAAGGQISSSIIRYTFGILTKWTYWKLFPIKVLSFFKLPSLSFRKLLFLSVSRSLVSLWSMYYACMTLGFGELIVAAFLECKHWKLHLDHIYIQRTMQIVIAL